MKGKGGKSFKKTTSKGRKIRRSHTTFRWPEFDADDFLASTTTNAERSSPASKVSRVAEREEMSA